MSGESGANDAGYDDWLDALEDDRAYYVECAEGHGMLPPRRVCPECGSTDLGEEPLPDVGEIETSTITHVPTPSFEDDAPYVTAIANFGPVRVTGQVVGVDVDDVEVGATVALEVSVSETTGDRLIALRPR